MSLIQMSFLDVCFFFLHFTILYTIILDPLRPDTGLKNGCFGKLIKFRFLNIIYYIIENSLLLHEFVFKYVQYI